MPGRSTILMLGTALALVTGSAAQAQTAAAQSAPANGAATPDPQEIVVTATRRSEGIQHVPQSITALTGHDLSQLNAKTLGDFAG